MCMKKFDNLFICAWIEWGVKGINFTERNKRL